MITLQEIKIFPYKFCMEVFDSFFDQMGIDHTHPKYDFENIHNFLLCSYPEARDQFSWKLNHLNTLPEIIFFVYDIGNNIIGYCSIFPSRWNPMANNEVEFGLFVKKSERNKGYGKEILKQLEEYVELKMPHIDVIGLAPLLSNTRAIDLYEREGWDFASNSLALSMNMMYMTKEINKKNEIDTSKTGYIAIICGEGKGKTTALMGQALRASGQGWKTCIIQFLKDKNTGEYLAISKYLPHVDIFPLGPDNKITFNHNKNISDKELAQSAWSLLKRIAPAYEILLIDEILPAIEMGLLEEKEVVEWLDNKPAYLEVFMTGRYVPDRIKQRAHLISKIEPEKHWFKDFKLQARKGIEY